jgi:uncharacterized protein YbjT (DUF2867 family)
MTILLIGAHGRTGQHVARRLAAAGLPFKVLLRRAEQAGAFRALHAQIVLGDLTQDFSHAFDGVTGVVYAAGSSESEGDQQERQIDRDAVKHTADLVARRHAGKLVVISAISAYWPERSPLGLQHYSQMKREGDDYVISHPHGIDYVIVRPGPLSDDPATGTIALATERAASATPVSREDVADVTVRVLNGDVHRAVFGFVGGDVPIDAAIAAAVRDGDRARLAG